MAKWKVKTGDYDTEGIPIRLFIEADCLEVTRNGDLIFSRTVAPLYSSMDYGQEIVEVIAKGNWQRVTKVKDPES